MIPSTKVYTKEYNQRNKTKEILLGLTSVVIPMLGGCVLPEEPEGVCLDYKSFRTVVEECTPLYGQLICIEKEKVRVICTKRESSV